MSKDHPTGGDKDLWINEGEKRYDEESSQEVNRATSTDIVEVYGAKFQIFTSDRDVRLVFGNMYPTVRDGLLTMEARYRVSIVMPIRSFLEFNRLAYGMAQRIEDDIKAEQEAFLEREVRKPSHDK